MTENMDQNIQKERQEFREHVEHIMKFLPEIEFLRNEVARLRFEKNGLLVKHENSLRNLESLKLDNKKLMAQLEVAVAVARKTEAFNLENRSSFVMQNVQLETSKKERDILEERIVKLQFENVNLKTRVQDLEDLLRVKEKTRQIDAIMDKIKAGTIKATRILQTEKENILKWISRIRELGISMSHKTAAQRRLIQELKAQKSSREDEADEPPERCSTKTDDKEFSSPKLLEEPSKEFVEMQIRLSEALNKSASYEAALNKAVSLMIQLTNQKKELNLKLANMGTKIDRPVDLKENPLTVVQEEGEMKSHKELEKFNDEQLGSEK